MSSFVDNLKTLLHESVIQIEFTKKDGTERVMKCTRDFSKIPAEFHPKEDTEKKPNENLIKVWDMEKTAWRSVRVDSINRWCDLTPPLNYNEETKKWTRQ